MINQALSLIEIKSTIKEILEDYGIEQKALTDQASFSNDLGFDSLDFAELLMTLENRFDIAIPFHLIEESNQNIEALSLIIKAEISK